jgi:hypothetical protein
MTERTMRFAVDQLKSSMFIDTSCVNEYGGSPKRQPDVAGRARERNALPYQSCPEAAPTHSRLDQQQPQLRHSIILSNTENAAYRNAVKPGDPRCLARRIMTPCKAGDDICDECFKFCVPAVLVRVQLAMASHDPVHVTGRRCAHRHRKRLGRGRGHAAYCQRDQSSCQCPLTLRRATPDHERMQLASKLTRLK